MKKNIFGLVLTLLIGLNSLSIRPALAWFCNGKSFAVPCKDSQGKTLCATSTFKPPCDASLGLKECKDSGNISMCGENMGSPSCSPGSAPCKLGGGRTRRMWSSKTKRD